MKSHHLGALVAAAVIAIAAGLWTSKVHEPAPLTAGAGAPLLPGLEEAVNDVTGLILVGPDYATIATLSRGADTWTLAEKAGHPANVPAVRELLLKLARAKLLEEKTSNPEYYKRLGVEDVDAEDAGGVLVKIEGVDLPPVVVGNVERARDAVYVRLADQPASWLASGDIAVSKDVLNWLNRDVIDVSASRIAEVEITHPDGEVVRISKAAFGQPNFDVADIPAGREIKWATVANSMGSVLEGLRIDDVLPLDESGFSELKTTRAAFRAFDGYVIYADVAAKDDKYYARFSAGTDAATAAHYLPGGEEKTATPNLGSGDQDITVANVPSGDTGGEMKDQSSVSSDGQAAASRSPEADLSVVTAEAEKQNRLSAGWVYVIPKFKYDQMTRRMKDLLKEPA